MFLFMLIFLVKAKELSGLSLANEDVFMATKENNLTKENRIVIPFFYFRQRSNNLTFFCYNSKVSY